jgi:ABC-type antimicrobial peptide transport system permease subunit
MDQRYLIKFASKNLVSHKLRTLLTIVGMVIGISAITFLIAFAFGVESIVTKEITGGNAFELIDIGTGNSQIVKLNQETLGKVKGISGINSIETISNLAAVSKDEKGDGRDVSLFVTTAKYMEWSSVESKWGETLATTPPDESIKKAVVTTMLAQELSYPQPQDALGKTIALTVVAPKDLTKSGEKKTVENQDFKVVGVTKSDSSAVYVGKELEAILELQNFSQAKAEVKNRQEVEKVRAQIENMGLKTQYVGETVEQVEQVFMFFKIILGSFGLIAMIVASLAMFNTLTISLLERTKEVALLKILGMRKADISRLFLTEALVMGILGGISGVITGIVLSSFANFVFNHYAVQSGGDPISVFVYPVWFIIAVFLFSILVGFMTGLYPARRAMRINALDVMRYE